MNLVRMIPATRTYPTVANAITCIGQNNNTTNNLTITVTSSSSVVIGDLLVVIVSLTANYGGAVPISGSGWTQQSAYYDPTNYSGGAIGPGGLYQQTTIFYKKAASSDVGSHTYLFSSGYSGGGSPPTGSMWSTIFVIKSSNNFANSTSQTSGSLNPVPDSSCSFPALNYPSDTNLVLLYGFNQQQSGTNYTPTTSTWPLYATANATLISSAQFIDNSSLTYFGTEYLYTANNATFPQTSVTVASTAGFNFLSSTICLSGI